jgi:hypothetical protein
MEKAPAIKNRHCERSEAIQRGVCGSWIASSRDALLAMTMK